MFQAVHTGADLESAIDTCLGYSARVEKIFGPGNQHACRPIGSLVIADKYANPVHIAADLLSQAEHGPNSQVVLVISGDGVDVAAIEKEISKQCKTLPRREFTLKALSHSFIVFAHNMFELYHQDHQDRILLELEMVPWWLWYYILFFSNIYSSEVKLKILCMRYLEYLDFCTI
ncbi:hypothetical protein IFM89_013558 [Coptis chinensis]|uniref:Histidinol dehydrogenase n=1 Tax=Coptis chinensis TaxID=261450 RepID=A0A835I373_9MAGN|nr:hypothetical protein IFM89_013558 [Coptis chinensis]